MDKRERNWLFVLIAVFIIVNVLTFSSLVPWQAWMLWENHTPDRTVTIHYEDYQIQMETPPRN